jgi:hypothetical protein
LVFLPVRWVGRQVQSLETKVLSVGRQAFFQRPRDTSIDLVASSWPRTGQQFVDVALEVVLLAREDVGEVF